MVGTTVAVELVKRSVLQCFCRSCDAKPVEKPILPVHNEVKTRPPKKVIFVAEVRATEQSKGGMKYELVLSEPTIENPPKRPVSPPKSSSAEDIEGKLKAAEERRQNLETQKLSQLTEKKSKIQEVTQKKQEFNNNFMQITRENLEQKMEVIKENREAHLKAIQEKLKEHERHIEEVRQNKNQPAEASSG